MKLSILMPVYNELNTLPSAVKDVLSVDYPCDVELVIVDLDREPVLLGVDR